MGRYTKWAFALAAAATWMGVTAGAAAQEVIDMTRGRLDRCELHRSLGRQVPPECGGPGAGAADTTRGRVVIGGQRQGAPGPAAGAPAGQAPGGQAAAGTSRCAPMTRGCAIQAPPADRPPPSRATPYAVAVPVPFDFDSDRLTTTGRWAVDQLAEVFKLNAQDKFIIQGHTDAVGTEEYNKELSMRRAQAVADYLVQKHGISRDRLETQGLGESNLLLPGDPTNGRNRRVQILNVGG